MSKITASSVFGLVAVPTAIAAATRDKGSVKAVESDGKTKCDKTMLIAILAAIALAGVAASVALARASALLPSWRPTASLAHSGYRSGVARFCGIDRISEGCVGHARHPWVLKI